MEIAKGRFPQVGRDGCNFRFGKKNCRAYFTQLLPDGAPPPLTLSPRWPGTIFVRFSERNRSTIETIIQPVEEDGLLGAVDLGGKLDRIRCTRGLMECVIGAGNRSPFERERTFRCRNHASRRCKREILDFRMNRKFPSVSGIGIGIGRSREEKKRKIKIYRRRVTLRSLRYTTRCPREIFRIDGASRGDFQSPSLSTEAARRWHTRKIDTWASNGPTKTDPTGTRQQKRMHIMNGWTRRRRNGCQKYIASVHPLPPLLHAWMEGGERRKREKGRGKRRQKEGGRKRTMTMTRRRCRKKRMRKSPSSRIPPFISGFVTRSRPARQKISKIRRVARGTVRPGAQTRIYKERSHDLCPGLGYLSISMAHAIPLHGYRYVFLPRELCFFPLCLFLSFPPAVYALRRYNRRLFLVLRETSISNFVGASRSKLLRPLKRPPLREKSSVYFFYDRLMPRAGGAASKEEKMRPITRSERGAVLGTGAAVCRAIINSGKSISSKRLLPKPRL